jgi:hypothetical protein
VDTPTVLTAGSTNAVNVRFTSTSGTAINVTVDYVVPPSVTFTAADQALSFDAASSGFAVRAHRIGTPRGPGTGNSVEATETQLAGRFTDALHVPLANLASTAGSTGGVFTVPLINFEQFGDDIDIFNPTNSPDNFNSVEPAGRARPNTTFPGISIGVPDHFALEVLTFLELSAGCHTLGVNSDEGFRVTLGHSQFGTVLGEFDRDVGRRAADTTFQIIVTNAGVYPIRLAYSEGIGDASLEFFSVTASGEKILINDRANTNAIRAYSAGTTPGFLSDFGVTQTRFGIEPGSRLIATFMDRATALDDASVRITLDRVPVTPLLTNNGPVTTFTFEPERGFALGTEHTARIVYTIGGARSTNRLTFRVRVGGLFVEAENFDFGNGQFLTNVNTMPYSGGEYAGRGAVHDADYHSADNLPAGAENYRVGEVPNVPIYVRTNANSLDFVRGNFLVTTNFSVAGSTNAATDVNWYDYTRTFTNGNYFIFAAQSFGEEDDTNNLPDRQRLRFALLGTNGVEQIIGSYSESSSAGANTLNQVMIGPVPAVVTLGGTQTIRVSQGEGDFDWFVLVPTTNAVPEQQFIIEAEDFDFGGGQSIPAASIMPLTNAPYANLSAVHEVDYHLTDSAPAGEGPDYRTNEIPNVPITLNDARSQGDRGNYVRAPNYTVGPLDNGDWFNYTREFPTNNYHVYAALSHAGTSGTNRAAGSLQRITTGTNQVVTELGSFEAEEPTGGWGNNRLVPMQINGELGTVALGGTNTVRFTAGSGALDYLVFVPTTEEVTQLGPRITSITRNGNQITVTWVGGGVLETSPTPGPNGVWTPVPSTGPGMAVVPLTGQQLYFRVRVGGDTPEGPRITSITRSAAQITVTWVGGGTLESSPVVGPGAVWTAVPGAGAGTATVPMDGTRRFFRVRR